MSSRQPGSRELLAVGGLALVAFGLHLSQLHQSLYGDEILAYRDIAGHSLSQTINIVAHNVESSPPLFFILAWFTARLGDPTVWIRLPTLIFGSALIPVTYLIGLETIGRRGALIGAAVAAVSPFAAYYGVEARPYATAEFFVALSTLGLLRASRTRRNRDWALFTFAAAAAAYSHYTTVFALITEIAWAAWICRRDLRPLMISVAVIIVVYLPWLPSLHGSALGVYSALEPLTATHVIRDSLHTVMGYSYASLNAIPTLPGVVAILLCAVIGVVFVTRRGFIVKQSQTGSRMSVGLAQEPVLLVVLLALAAPVGVLLYSLIFTDLWDPRNLITSAPDQIVVLGGLLANTPRRVVFPLTTVVLGFLTFGTIRAMSPRYARPPYRTVAAYLDRRATPSDPVLLEADYLGLNEAITFETHKPHDFITSPPERWPIRPARSLTFVIIDRAVIPLLRSRIIPHPPGSKLVTRQNYTGILDFSVLTYQTDSVARPGTR